MFPLLKRHAPMLVFLACLFVFSLILPAHFSQGAVFAKYPLAAKTYVRTHQLPEWSAGFSFLYLLVHILVYKFSSDPYRLILFTQIVFTGVSAVLLFLILSRFFPFLLSVLGAGAFLLNKSIILYTLTLEPEIFLTCFTLAFVYFLLSETPAGFVLAGMFFAFALLTRPVFSCFLILLPLMWAFYFRGAKKILSAFFYFFLPVICLGLLSVLLNHAIRGTYDLEKMDPGTVFYEGNNPLSHAGNSVYPPVVHDYALTFADVADFQHRVYRYVAQHESGKSLSDDAVGRFWFQKSANFIQDHPFAFFRRLMLKGILLFHGYRRHDIEHVFLLDRNALQQWPAVPLPLISSMAILGLIASWGKRRQMYVLYLTFLIPLAGLMMFFVTDRYRVILIAPMIFFAVSLCHYFFEKRQTGTGKRSVFPAVLILLTILFSVDNDVVRDEKYTWKNFALSHSVLEDAEAARNREDRKTASDLNAEAYALTPAMSDKIRLAEISYPEKSFEKSALDFAVSHFDRRNPSALFDIGVLSLSDHRLDEAERIFRRLRGKTFSRFFVQSSLPEFYLGRIYEIRNRPDTAASFFNLKNA
jgi:hypothetical protein